MAEYFDSVREAMRERLLLESPPKIWVACSGGLDSMLLMHTLAAVCPPQVQLEVLHMNFQLRGEESDADAAFVRAQSAALGLASRVLAVDPKEQGSSGKGIQEWARDTRYRWFRSLMGDADWLALAHHKDDLIETILMRIARGTPLGQLIGMEEFRDFLWRPFLSLSRPTLEREAMRERIRHREDSSNIKLIYSRNIIRHRILPELEALYPGVRQSLSHLAQDALDFSRFSEETGKSFNVEELPKLPGAVARQRLGHYLSRWIGAEGLRRETLERLRTALIAKEELTLELNARFRVKAKDGHVEVEAAHRKRSTRWEQYRRGLDDSRPVSWLSEGASFEPTKRLEGKDRIVDND